MKKKTVERLYLEAKIRAMVFALVVTGLIVGIGIGILAIMVEAIGGSL